MVAPLIEEARQEGRQEGRQQARIEQAHRMLTIVVNALSPGLTIPVAIRRLTDLSAIESLAVALGTAGSPAEVKAALVQAAKAARVSTATGVRPRR